jgi:hypothetical protein
LSSSSCSRRRRQSIGLAIANEDRPQLPSARLPWGGRRGFAHRLLPSSLACQGRCLPRDDS